MPIFEMLIDCTHEWRYETLLKQCVYDRGSYHYCVKIDVRWYVSNQNHKSSNLLKKQSEIELSIARSQITGEVAARGLPISKSPSDVGNFLI